LDVYPILREESAYWLAQTYLKALNDDKASKVLDEMLETYNKGKVARGYYLSRVYYEKGKIAIRRNDFERALHNFKRAEETAKGNLLSTDQKLDLWIQQSAGYLGQGKFDEAILILSKVVNNDAISSLRLKAMYLRAETYELQGRPELARKQLESVSRKGGVWAQKAKEKLEKEYGY